MVVPAAPDQQQTADYVAQMSLALRRMAANAGLPRLARLLEEVTNEAIQQGGMPRIERKIHSEKPRR
jgi:hypothetical protein